jgi:diguanylate cyclase (GGDEF)-like protein
VVSDEFERIRPLTAARICSVVFVTANNLRTTSVRYRSESHDLVLVRSRPHGARISKAWPTVLVAITFAASSVATLAVARQRSDRVSASARAAFAGTAERMSTAVRIQLQRTTDVADNTGTYVKVASGMTQDQFQTWFDSGGMDRRPGLLGLGFIDRVSSTALATYEAERQRAADWPSASTFSVEPAGDRLAYCFVRFQDQGAAAAIGRLPPGFDICAAGRIGELLRQAMQTGQATVMAISAPNGESKTDPYLADGLRAIGGSAFAILEPVYDGTPGNAAERLASIRGWVVGAFDGPALVQTALGHDYETVALRLTWVGAGVTSVIAESAAGIGPEPGHSSLDYSVALDGGWRLSLSAPDSAVRASARRNATVAIALGGLLTMLLVTLMLVLSGSRNRALRMVEVKTVQLRHQTLHDALTGLPNRALVLDRATQLLVRARREGTVAAALFLDLDGFKAVNDSFGHHVGDALLCAVASRLQAVLRASETIARLGGDEFVVLAEGGPPDALAERIIAAMAEPFDLGDVAGRPVSVGVSIGIATGSACDANELLREADVAMYRAKASGRGRFMIFDLAMDEAPHEAPSAELKRSA